VDVTNNPPTAALKPSLSTLVTGPSAVNSMAAPVTGLTYGNVTDNRDYELPALQKLKRDEVVYQIAHNHLQLCQVEVTDKMRSILVDWLVDVHLKYKCRPETLYLAVVLLDRYLMVKPVEKKKLQLIGCVAMMLACKYEEIMPPEVRQFVHISANTYTKTDMLQMEKMMLVELGFRLTVPTIWQFLNTGNEGETRDPTRHGAEYLAEQSLMCGRMCGFPPSMQAATCILLARRILNGEAWDQTMVNKTGYTEFDLQPAVTVLDEYLRRVPLLRVSAVRKKYKHTRYSCISTVFDSYQ